MKKEFIISIIVLVVLMPTCFLLYNHFTDEKGYKNYFNLETMPRIDASTATQPLTDAFAKYFGNEEVLENVKVNYTNTHPAYVKLINNETDLIIVTEPSKEELQLAKDKGVELEVTKIVNEGFVFFVNSNNPVDNLDLNKIVDIYSGKITNWNKVGGNDANIIAYQRPTNSGSQTGMLSLVMKDVKMKDPTTEEAVATMGEIIDVVADYDNNVSGIGYSYYYYANIMYNSPNIKFLGINGIKPTYDTISDGSYPIMTAYYIVTRKDADENTKKLKEILLSEEGAKVAKEAGYVPIK